MGIDVIQKVDFWITAVLDYQFLKLMKGNVIDVKVSLSKNAEVPSGDYNQPAGHDLSIYLNKDIVIGPLERHVLDSGVSMEIPTGYCGLICPRSGITSRTGLTILNSPGVIDSDFRGSIKVIVVNSSYDDVVIRNGVRIAQILFVPVMKPNFIIVKKLGTTKRNLKGIGSSDAKAKANVQQWYESIPKKK